MILKLHSVTLCCELYDILRAGYKNRLLILQNKLTRSYHGASILLAMGDTFLRVFLRQSSSFRTKNRNGGQLQYLECHVSVGYQKTVHSENGNS